MNRFSQSILSAAAMAVMSACSGADQPEPTALHSQTSQTSPVAPAMAPLAVSTPAGPVMEASEAEAALGDVNEVARLRGIALAISSIRGVSSPKTMHVVTASDHQAAATLLSGAIINDHSPVYVVKMTGGPFTATSHPPGVPAPQGNVLTVTIDATTHRVTDVGYHDEEPDLGQIGSHPVEMSAP
ncbi:MAG TPA: hypothetical protein VK762_05460 [Polyangiaceae bacterium]|jgi:hypothetical protein|nr:hypothetical protein [Polyangiaceae bacterium]